jgi:hypothetical protein
MVWVYVFPVSICGVSIYVIFLFMKSYFNRPCNERDGKEQLYEQTEVGQKTEESKTVAFEN